jgi:hypothetical protein
MAARTTAAVSFAIFFIFGVGCSWRGAVANCGSWGGFLHGRRRALSPRRRASFCQPRPSQGRGDLARYSGHRYALVTFIKEDIGMFTPPSRAALPVFTDNDSKPHAGATIAIFATLAQLQHALTQFVAHYPSPWWRRWSNRDRRCSRRRAILRRNHDPCSVATLLVTSLLVVTVAARPRLALRSNGSTGGPAHDRADCGPAPAVQCSA